MRFSLCNEVLRDLPFADQCAMAAGLGYEGLEIAPFTLSNEPHLISASRRREWRAIAEDHGLAITGLHWLLAAPGGLSITSSDGDVKARTRDVMVRLVEMCADFGGSVLIHGSPAQRKPEDAESREAARANAVEAFRIAGEAAHKAGVQYCIEALSTRETDFINTIEEALDILREADTPGLHTMIDTKAATISEPASVADTIARHWPSGHVVHVHVNDSNARAPGQGDDRFGPVFDALKAVDYRGVVSVEPFIYEPDGPTTAARAIGYLRGLLEPAGGGAT